MAQRARDSVAPLRRSSAGWMAARIGRLSVIVGRRHLVTIRKASLNKFLLQHHKRAIVFNLQPTGNFDKLPWKFTFFQALVDK